VSFMVVDIQRKRNVVQRERERKVSEGDVCQETEEKRDER